MGQRTVSFLHVLIAFLLVFFIFVSNQSNYMLFSSSFLSAVTLPSPSLHPCLALSLFSLAPSSSTSCLAPNVPILLERILRRWSPGCNPARVQNRVQLNEANVVCPQLSAKAIVQCAIKMSIFSHCLCSSWCLSELTGPNILFPCRLFRWYLTSTLSTSFFLIPLHP